jgi:hypothetical protein
MGFCTNCGAQVTGAFCQQCGRPAQGQPAPAPPPPPQPLTAPVPAGRRTSPIVWVLLALVGIVVLGGIAVVGTGLFVARKIHQAGPAVTAGKLLAALNPDLEVIDADERSGVITVREKSTGKEITLNFDDIKRGRISVSDGGRHGKGASIEIGASNAKLPSWVPAYPGASAEATISINSDEGQGSSFNFKTSDAPAKVMEFYREGLKQAGLKISMTTTTGEGGVVAAEDNGAGRGILVTVSGADGGSAVVLLCKGK